MFSMNPEMLERLLKAIGEYNKEVFSMAESGDYTVVPNPTSIEKELGLISDKRTYNQRVNQLERITDSDAADVVTRYGVVVPRYMRDEIYNITRQANVRRASYLLDFFPDWDLMTAPEKATAYSNRNLEPLYEEDYYSSNMFDLLLEEAYPNMPDKAKAYINVWLDMTEDEDIASMIMEMAEKNPDGFRKLMESPDDEKEIEYIYPDEFRTGRKGSFSNFNYKRTSAFKDDYTIRIDNASSYWTEQYNDFLMGEGYFK